MSSPFRNEHLVYFGLEAVSLKYLGEKKKKCSFGKGDLKASKRKLLEAKKILKTFHWHVKMSHNIQ